MNSKIPVRIKNTSHKVLEYKTQGAVGFDFEAVHTVTIEPGKMGLIDTGVVIEIPEGYMMMLTPRSSTFKNYGLMMVNSVGIIDQDYRGETDTNKFAYINMTDMAVTVPAGERIGQGIFVAIARAQFELVESMGNADRGGFGTTGR